MRLAGADTPVYVESGAPVACERGDVLGELGAVGLGGPVAPWDARARERLLPAGGLLLGGEGRAPVGRPGPVTPWGKPAMGYKTRKGKNPTNKFIVKRRNEKYGGKSI